MLEIELMIFPAQLRSRGLKDADGLAFYPQHFMQINSTVSIMLTPVFSPSPPLRIGPDKIPPLKFPPCEKKFPPQLMPQRWFSSIFAVGNVFFKGKTRLEAQKFSPAALRGQKTSKTM